MISINDSSSSSMLFTGSSALCSCFWHAAALAFGTLLHLKTKGKLPYRQHNLGAKQVTM